MWLWINDPAYPNLSFCSLFSKLSHLLLFWLFPSLVWPRSLHRSELQALPKENQLVYFPSTQYFTPFTHIYTKGRCQERNAWRLQNRYLLFHRCFQTFKCGARWIRLGKKIWISESFACFIKYPAHTQWFKDGQNKPLKPPPRSINVNFLLYLLQIFFFLIKTFSWRFNRSPLCKIPWPQSSTSPWEEITIAVCKYSSWPDIYVM